MQTFLPLCDTVAKNSSLASMKLSSADSINVRNQQVRPIRVAYHVPSSHSNSSYCFNNNTNTSYNPCAALGLLGHTNGHHNNYHHHPNTNNNHHHYPYTNHHQSHATPHNNSNIAEYSSIVTLRTIPSVIEETALEVPELVTLSRSNSPATTNTATTADAEEQGDGYSSIGAGIIVRVEQKPTTLNFQLPQTPRSLLCARAHTIAASSGIMANGATNKAAMANGAAAAQRVVDFRINSVGRSFIDSVHDDDERGGGGGGSGGGGNGTDAETCASLNTPETPTPNISPSSSNRFSEAGFTEGDGCDASQLAPSTPSIVVSPMLERSTMTATTGCENNGVMVGVGMVEDDSDGVAGGNGGGGGVFRPSPSFNLMSGSWDLLELDMDFHDVNFDPSFGGDVEECIYYDGDDPFGILPIFPTPPDAIDL